VPPKALVLLCELVKLMLRIPTYNFAYVLKSISIGTLHGKRDCDNALFSSVLLLSLSFFSLSTVPPYFAKNCLRIRCV
jgi:hypothetical protein